MSCCGEVARTDLISQDWHPFAVGVDHNLLPVDQVVLLHGPQHQIPALVQDCSSQRQPQTSADLHVENGKGGWTASAAFQDSIQLCVPGAVRWRLGQTEQGAVLGMSPYEWASPSSLTEQVWMTDIGTTMPGGVTACLSCGMSSSAKPG